MGHAVESVLPGRLFTPSSHRYHSCFHVTSSYYKLAVSDEVVRFRGVICASRCGCAKSRQKGANSLAGWCWHARNACISGASFIRSLKLCTWSRPGSLLCARRGWVPKGCSNITPYHRGIWVGWPRAGMSSTELCPDSRTSVEIHEKLCSPRRESRCHQGPSASVLQPSPPGDWRPQSTGTCQVCSPSDSYLRAPASWRGVWVSRYRTISIVCRDRSLPGGPRIGE